MKKVLFILNIMCFATLTFGQFGKLKVKKPKINVPQKKAKTNISNNTRKTTTTEKSEANKTAGTKEATGEDRQKMVLLNMILTIHYTKPIETSIRI